MKGINRGEKNGMWKGNDASENSARERAWHVVPNVPKGYERHHIDGNIYNNNPSNIMIVTRKEHMTLDGRLERMRKTGHKWKKGQCGNPLGGHPKNGLFAQSFIQCKNCVSIQNVDDSFICMDDKAINSSKKGGWTRFGFYGKNPERRRQCLYYKPISM